MKPPDVDDARARHLIYLRRDPPLLLGLALLLVLLPHLRQRPLVPRALLELAGPARGVAVTRRGPNSLKIEKETTHDLV